jgi:hypothetical protein
MPVQKFRTWDDARRALWCDPDDPTHLRRMAQLLRFSARLHPRSYPPGVYKYRSLEDAQRDRDAWEREVARRLRDQRQS